MADKKKKPEYQAPEAYKAPEYQAAEIAPLTLEAYRPSDELTALRQQQADWNAAYPVNSQNRTAAQGLLDQYLNRGAFSYDMEADPIYKAYRDQYVREGKNAMADTIAEAATYTGGYGNSYGTTAGAAAYQSYLDKLNDRVPELYQAAYDRYVQEGNDLYNRYGAARTAAQDELDEYYNRANYLGNLVQQMYGNEYGEWGDRNSNTTAMYNAAMQAEAQRRQNYEADRAFNYALYGDTADRAYDLYKTDLSDYWQGEEFDEGQRQFNEQMAENKRQFNASNAVSWYNATKSGSSGSKTASAEADPYEYSGRALDYAGDLGFKSETEMRDALMEEAKKGEAPFRYYMRRLGSGSGLSEEVLDAIFQAYVIPTPEANYHTK